MDGVIAMRVVFGGAFNPPTKAHLEVYRFLTDKLPVESFVFLPVSNRYKKKGLVADSHRLRMLEIMTKDLPDAEVSDLEIRDDSYQGTYASLVRLARPGQKTAFVIGADHLERLPHWKEAEKLLTEFVIIVLNRGNRDLADIIGTDSFLKRHKRNIRTFPGFDLPVSASSFRQQKDKRLVTRGVYAYIEENGLYGG